MSNAFPSHSREPKNQSQSDLRQFAELEALFSSDRESLTDKLDAFPKYVPRQTIAKFLTKYEIFQRIIGVNGSIVEAGVLHGGGTLAWAKLSSILEPTNHTRKVIGFDTFAGFPSVAEQDLLTGDGSLSHVGGLRGSPRASVDRAIHVYNMNRPLSHIEKVELVEGDISTTAPAYLEANPHLVVSLLYLDVDLYEPSKVMLQTFVPRMPRGAIIAFDELNAKMFPGETTAADEVLGLMNLRLRRFPFDSYVSYCVVGE